MNTSTIFDNIMSANKFARLLMKKNTILLYFTYADLYDCFYKRGLRLFGVNFALNKRQKLCFKCVPRGGALSVE